MPVKLTSGLRSGAAERARKTHDAVAATVFRVEAGAKVRARVDTGEMRNGLQGDMTGEYEGHVRGLAAHTIFNEFGTVHMAAQPMLVPAAHEARIPFVRAVTDAWGG
jgi:hypothetical protein